MDIDDAQAVNGNDGFVRASDMTAAVFPDRLSTGGAWDKNFGTHYTDDGTPYSGVANGTVTLIGGKNGSGKSTLVMHMAKAIIDFSNVKTNPKCAVHEDCHRRDVMYLSAEEINNALRSRMKRLEFNPIHEYHMVFSPLGQKVNLDQGIAKYKPILLIGDSISKIQPDIDKAVEWCDDLRLYCDKYFFPALIINHINKAGDQAGMEALQHSVDAVLVCSIDTDKIRIIETSKNRNGEDGIRTLYSMTEEGLVNRKDLEQELKDDEDEDLDEESDNDDDDNDEDENE